MPTYLHEPSLELMLNNIASLATHVRLLDDYDRSHSFATVGTNTVGSNTVEAADFSVVVAGYDRRLVFGGKSLAASQDSSVNNFHVALTSATDVLLVTTEFSFQPVLSGQTVTIPTFFTLAVQASLV